MKYFCSKVINAVGNAYFSLNIFLSIFIPKASKNGKIVFSMFKYMENVRDLNPFSTSVPLM